MKTIFFIIGNLWMLPNTIIGTLLLALFYATRSVAYVGHTRWSLKFVAIRDSWISRAMRESTGWSFGGPFILLQDGHSLSAKLIKHEDRHVLQQMVFGVLHWPLYVAGGMYIALFMQDKHYYRDNPFEIDARRAAGDG